MTRTCAECGQQIWQYELDMYGGQPYHHECLREKLGATL